MHVSIYLIMSRAHMISHLLLTFENSHAHYVVIQAAPIVRLLSLEWLAHYEHVVQSLSSMCLCMQILNTHLTTYHSQTCIHILFLVGFASFMWELIKKIHKLQDHKHHKLLTYQCALEVTIRAWLHHGPQSCPMSNDLLLGSHSHGQIPGKCYSSYWLVIEATALW